MQTLFRNALGAAVRATGVTLLAFPALAQDATATLTQDQCSAATLASGIDPDLIGEPVSGVRLTDFTWVEASEPNPAYCRVEGAMAPIDPDAPDILFAVALPEAWSGRAAQIGGGGDNGVIPNIDQNAPRLRGTILERGWVAYGSDSGHAKDDPNWALNDEAVANFGFMQMKKTHDAAWEIIQRAYGAEPEYSYYLGNSQGGREGLTVAQRYPDDYDGVMAQVPVINFSTLQLSSALRQIHEKPEANWLPPAKVEVVRAEIMRQCDDMDGLTDGVIMNYMACRANFDPSVGENSDPWAPIRCPDGVDPAPEDTSADACVTDGQISTLVMAYTPYEFATPLANGTTSFGMWVPSVDVVGPPQAPHVSSERYQGQEGAPADATVSSWAASAKILSYYFGDLSANPLDYVEGGDMDARRLEISQMLDSTDPDLSAFAEKGGKLLSISATADTRASSGSQLDYYQAVIDEMGREAVDEFARLWIVPQGNHGQSGTSVPLDPEAEVFDLPNMMPRLDALVAWVEEGRAPPMAPTVTNETGRSVPLCSYPSYPHYDGSGPTDQASSYSCRTN
ncbi:tannase/feruloyl esterase family alpha/beta hydrolase [Salipiger thiooxidans]|uniref:tannase/feruloyl esterase family alpha/beta hydrolase n=1 Tax=Salipiger thiooxidans TaxID=282683 RepID=UPI001CD58DE3|nr:tannase/feruloyl esterase family alpha/beta hydrolase [Salipiger thiooxidans]MCA0851519.1 tannase/feruloyl esterase family alpha/beta hydrolase [Salipiger thiooxidans]